MKKDPFSNPRFGIGNIDLLKRPVVKLNDGSTASVYSSSYNIDGQEVLLPRIREGLDRPMTDEEAVSWYKQTGEYLGKFKTVSEANEYADWVHKNQEKLLKVLGKN